MVLLGLIWIRLFDWKMSLSLGWFNTLEQSLTWLSMCRQYLFSFGFKASSPPGAVRAASQFDLQTLWGLFGIILEIISVWMQVWRYLIVLLSLGFSFCERFALHFIMKLTKRIEFVPRGIYCSRLCISLAFQGKIYQGIWVWVLYCVVVDLWGTLNFQGKSDWLNKWFEICQAGFLDKEVMCLEANTAYFLSRREQILNK